MLIKKRVYCYFHNYFDCQIIYDHRINSYYGFPIWLSFSNFSKIHYHFLSFIIILKLSNAIQRNKIVILKNFINILLINYTFRSSHGNCEHASNILFHAIVT